MILAWYDYLLEYGPMLLTIVASVVLWVRTKNVKYLKEVVSVIDKQIDSDGVVIESSSSAPRVGKYAQSFEGAELVPIYRLNKATGELEATGEYKNIQEYVQSFKDIALQAALDRFVPRDDKDIDELRSQVDDYSEFLDEYAYVLDRANQFADDEGLEEASVSEIFEAMRSKAEILKSRLSELQGKKNEKEVSSNASEKVSSDEAPQS